MRFLAWPATPETPTSKVGSFCGSARAGPQRLRRTSHGALVTLSIPARPQAISALPAFVPASAPRLLLPLDSAQSAAADRHDGRFRRHSPRPISCPAHWQAPAGRLRPAGLRPASRRLSRSSSASALITRRSRVGWERH